MEDKNQPSDQARPEDQVQLEDQVRRSDQTQLEQIRRKLDLSDGSTIQQFGAGVELRMADLSGQILSQVRENTGNDTQELIGELVNKLREQEPEENKSFLDHFPGLGKKRARVRYEKALAEVSEISIRLDKARMDLLKNIAMLDKMYEKNMGYYQRLELYIKVGEETLEYMKLQVIPGAQDKASASGDPMDQENVQKKQGMANDLERRVYQLKLARAMALQTGPQIRLLQTNSRSQADQIQQTLTTMIPSWEKRLATELNGYT